MNRIACLFLVFAAFFAGVSISIGRVGEASGLAQTPVQVVADPTPDECIDAIVYYARALGRTISPDTMIEELRQRRDIGGWVLCAVAKESRAPGLQPLRAQACAALGAEYPIGWQWMVELCEPCRN